MKFLTIAFAIILALSCVQAFLPKFPKLVWKYDDNAEDENPLFPTFGLFGRKIANTKEIKADKKESFIESLLDKDTLLEKIVAKKDDKFEDRLLDFFDDKEKAQKICDKLQKASEPDEEPAKGCKCKESVPVYDDCNHNIRYFS